MEIKNNSQNHDVVIVVGRRIAQILFFKTEDCGNFIYNKVGKYQTEHDFDLLKKNWKPNDMLPKMYKDREVKEIKY